jgi:hypothetical protein
MKYLKAAGNTLLFVVYALIMAVSWFIAVLEGL